MNVTYHSLRTHSGLNEISKGDSSNKEGLKQNVSDPCVEQTKESDSLWKAYQASSFSLLFNCAAVKQANGVEAVAAFADGGHTHLEGGKTVTEWFWRQFAIWRAKFPNETNSPIPTWNYPIKMVCDQNRTWVRVIWYIGGQWYIGRWFKNEEKLTESPWYR